jgi:hypothetical protein
MFSVSNGWIPLVYSSFFVRRSIMGLHTNKLLILNLYSIIYQGMLFIFSIPLRLNPHGLFMLFCLPKADVGFSCDIDGKFGLKFDLKVDSPCNSLFHAGSSIDGKFMYIYGL